MCKRHTGNATVFVLFNTDTSHEPNEGIWNIQDIQNSSIQHEVPLESVLLKRQVLINDLPSPPGHQGALIQTTPLLFWSEEPLCGSGMDKLCRCNLTPLLGPDWPMRRRWTIRTRDLHHWADRRWKGGF